MIGLRILGLIAGLFLFFIAFFLFRSQRIKRLHFLFWAVTGFFLYLVSVEPAIANIFRSILSFKQFQYSRIIALLIFSNFFAWFFLIYLNLSLSNRDRDVDALLLRLGADEFYDKYGTVKFEKISIVIPAHNEIENLKILLVNIENALKDLRASILIVDDGSTDNTCEYLRQKGYYIAANKINRGGGAALKLGSVISQRAGASVMVTMDADNQHDPCYIRDLIQPILDQKAEVVIGSRFKGRNEDTNKVRLIGLYVYNYLVTFFIGRKITDCSSGFRAFRINSLMKLKLAERQYHTSECIIEAAKKRLLIAEVPIVMKPRHKGKSKKGSNWRYGFNFLKVILKTWWRD